MCTLVNIIPPSKTSNKHLLFAEGDIPVIIMEKNPNITPG